MRGQHRHDPTPLPLEPQGTILPPLRATDVGFISDLGAGGVEGALQGAQPDAVRALTLFRVCGGSGAPLEDRTAGAPHHGILGRRRRGAIWYSGCCAACSVCGGGLCRAGSLGCPTILLFLLLLCCFVAQGCCDADCALLDDRVAQLVERAVEVAERFHRLPSVLCGLLSVSAPIGRWRCVPRPPP